MSEAFFRRVNDDDFIKFHNESASYTEFYKKLGYPSPRNIAPETREKIKEREIELGLNSAKAKPGTKPGKYYSVNKYCINCGKEISRHNDKYCSKECFIEYKKTQKIKHWKETGDTGTSVETTIRGCIREYILNKQNHKCSICGIENIWNGNPLIFVLDHINGDASNNNEDNLRLVCPNCDSQLSTYKSKNKHSARAHRRVCDDTI